MTRSWLKYGLSACLFACASSAAALTFPAVFEAEQRAELAAEREGKIAKLPVDTGSRVKQGDLLAEIAHKDLRLEKDRQEILENFYGIQVENLSTLNKRGVATDVELATASRDLDATVTDVAITDNKIERSIIRAPFSGIIVKRSTKPYEWVSAGETVVELVNPDALRALAFIPAQTAIQLKVGDTHRISVSAIGQEVTASILAIAPAVEEQSNTVVVIWKVQKKPKALLAGMKGEIQVDVVNDREFRKKAGSTKSKVEGKAGKEDALHKMSLDEVQKYIKSITD